MLLHAFQKKTQRTSKKNIDLAKQRLRDVQQYAERKMKSNHTTPGRRQYFCRFKLARSGKT